MTIKIFNPDSGDGFNKESFPIVNTPQPIKIKVDGDYVTFVKQDVEMFRLNAEDFDALIAAHTVLNGLVRCGAVFGEVENLRDLVQDLLGGS